MSITANDVTNAYQLILGCLPGPGESADQIAAEVTMKELVAAIDQAGLRIAQRAIREYFHPDTLWASAYVSGRTILTMVLEAA